MTLGVNRHFRPFTYELVRNYIDLDQKKVHNKFSKALKGVVPKTFSRKLRPFYYS